ncbi:hypothetical protein [Acinetobacter soli]|uniref:hypothetical protein n=1 Tax=Acinetobacter soli TaxID=487316 RepID=UPI0012500FBC|nr:hypothetical protein [Acinetobacter soli]MCE6007666.1 hypothetical protein [Acinetobacter soli]MDQ9833930.1 hypothetical protein [Acinetobacter soli]
MKKIAAVSVVGLVLVLGYGIYIDSRAKKRQEILYIIKDAEKGIKMIEANPNHINHKFLTERATQEQF